MTVEQKTFPNIQKNVPLEDERSRTPINQLIQWVNKGLPEAVDTEIAAAIAANASALPSFLAHKNSVNQVSISSATDVKITFPTEEWDTGGYYDAATSQWTPPAGKWRVSAMIGFAATNGLDNEDLIVRLYRDGVNFKQFIAHRGGNTADSVLLSTLVSASGSNVYEVYAFKSGAGDGEVLGVATSTWFCAEALA